MPEAQAAPAPAPAPAATPTEAGATEQTPAKPAVKLKGRAAHQAIRAKLAGSKSPAAALAEGAAKAQDAAAAAATAPAKADGDDKDSKAPAAKAATPTEPSEEKKPAVGAVMRLTAENTKLKSQLEELQGKIESAGKAETVESLRARVKKDPAILLDLFGADLSEDENERLTKLNDAVLARLDPAHAAERERDERVAKLEKELEAERAEKSKLTQREKEQARREHTARTLTEGYKDEIGETIVDSAKYPWVNHLTKVGEVDIHAGISNTVADLVRAFIAAQKRNPTDGEVAKMIAISASEAEEHFSKRSKNWQLPQAAAPAQAMPSAPERPTTIGSSLGGRAGGVDASKLSPREKHALIRERLRQSQRQQSPN
jgi:hypothetical protein